MEIIVLILLVCLAGLLGGYTMRYQETTLSVGKKLAQDNPLLPTGLQDAITPRGQTLRNILFPLLILIIFIYSLTFFRWYFALVFAIAAFFLVTPIFKLFIPKPESNFYLKKIRLNLVEKRETYKRNNDPLREAAVTGIITKFDSVYKDKKRG